MGKGFALGVAAFHLRAALVRLLWCAIHSETGIDAIPVGWMSGRSHRVDVLTIPLRSVASLRIAEAEAWLEFLFAGDTSGFAGWVRERSSVQNHPCERAIREADLEGVCDFVGRGSGGLS